eukprot:29066-Prorocentrum_lima.AAC.1
MSTSYTCHYNYPWLTLARSPFPCVVLVVLTGGLGDVGHPGDTGVPRLRLALAAESLALAQPGPTHPPCSNKKKQRRGQLTRSANIGLKPCYMIGGKGGGRTSAPGAP